MAAPASDDSTATAVAAIEKGLIVASLISVAWLDEALRPRNQVPLPRGTACWSLRATADRALGHFRARAAASSGCWPMMAAGPGASRRAAELARTACEWTLLLQLTSHADADFCWGDAGHLYFYGDREAMARGDFSRARVNFEN